MSMTLSEIGRVYYERFGVCIFRSATKSEESHVRLAEMALERGTPLTMEDYEAYGDDIPPDACS